MAKAKTDSVSGVEGQEGAPEAPLLTPDTPLTTTPDKPWDIDEAGHVLVHVPKDFRLTVNAYTELPFQAGEQRMHFSHLEHWYVKAHGVKPV